MVVLISSIKFNIPFNKNPTKLYNHIELNNKLKILLANKEMYFH